MKDWSAQGRAWLVGEDALAEFSGRLCGFGTVLTLRSRRTQSSRICSCWVSPQSRAEPRTVWPQTVVRVRMLMPVRVPREFNGQNCESRIIGWYARHAWTRTHMCQQCKCVPRPRVCVCGYHHSACRRAGPHHCACMLPCCACNQQVGVGARSPARSCFTRANS